MMKLKASNSILLTAAAVFSFSLFYAGNLVLFVYASPPLPPTVNTSIPNAESVYISESMKIPPPVGTFVILIPNEAHENWSDEKQARNGQELVLYADQFDNSKWNGYCLSTR
jgi:hypothetical protein